VPENENHGGTGWGASSPHFDAERRGAMTLSTVDSAGMVNVRASRSVLPGFRLSLGITLTALSLIVLLPLAALVVKAGGIGPAEFLRIATDERTLAALRLSFGISLFAALISAIFGCLLAWVLVRYRFPGRRLVDALVDLPFALPTAVAGITLTAIYAPNGLLGQFFAPLGLRVAFTPIGIAIALIFIGIPFVVRTVQPVLEEMEPEVEEASALLGANRWRTVSRVILPTILPALITGFTLAFARAVGEYGSVIFIAGNLPMVSEIAPLLIVIRLEEFDYEGAAVIGVLMLGISFLALLVINLVQAKRQRRFSDV
jgi:sulfate/thiosulfate transport system permease protein